MKKKPDPILEGLRGITDADATVRRAAYVTLTSAGTLDLLFIEPFAIGTGAGRALYEWAKARLKAAGETRMTILSDPDARGFYERMGADFVEDRPSDVFKGRVLPWLEAAL